MNSSSSACFILSTDYRCLSCVSRYCFNCLRFRLARINGIEVSRPYITLRFPVRRGQETRNIVPGPSLFKNFQSRHNHHNNKINCYYLSSQSPFSSTHLVIIYQLSHLLALSYERTQSVVVGETSSSHWIGSSLCHRASITTLGSHNELNTTSITLNDLCILCTWPLSVSSILDRSNNKYVQPLQLLRQNPPSPPPYLPATHHDARAMARQHQVLF